MREVLHKCDCNCSLRSELIEMRAIIVNQLALDHFVVVPTSFFFFFFLLMTYSYGDNWQALDKVMESPRVGRSQRSNSAFWESADVMVIEGTA